MRYTSEPGPQVLCGEADRHFHSISVQRDRTLRAEQRTCGWERSGTLVFALGEARTSCLLTSFFPLRALLKP